MYITQSTFFCALFIFSFFTQTHSDSYIVNPSTSCYNSCNKNNYNSINPNGSCSCNNTCISQNNCCADYIEYCASCASLGCVNYQTNRTCQCNSNCQTYNDCCDDYQEYCSKSHKNATECPYSPYTNINKNTNKNNNTKTKNIFDRRNNRSKLRIMSYNAKWLFTDYRHSQGSLICPGYCDWSTNTIANQHLQTLANYIATFDADIIFLEEVSDCWVLNQLINNMPMITIANSNSNQFAKDIYKPYLLFGKDTYTGQNCAMITKIDPITDLNRSDARFDYPLNGSNCGYTTSNNNNKKNYGCTKHFYADFNISGIDSIITMIGVHFLSKPTDKYNCAKREAQASVIADIIKTHAIANGYEVLVSGDFNDYADDIKDSENHIPTSRVTEIIRNAGNLTNVLLKIKSDDDEEDDDDFNNDIIYSDWYDQKGGSPELNDTNCIDDGGIEHSLIDQFYTSEKLYNLITEARIDHSYENYCDCLYSDHWPIIVDFDLSLSKNGSGHGPGRNISNITDIVDDNNSTSINIDINIASVTNKVDTSKNENFWDKVNWVDVLIGFGVIVVVVAVSIAIYVACVRRKYRQAVAYAQMETSNDETDTIN